MHSSKRGSEASNASSGKEINHATSENELLLWSCDESYPSAEKHLELTMRSGIHGNLAPPSQSGHPGFLPTPAHSDDLEKPSSSAKFSFDCSSNTAGPATSAEFDQMLFPQTDHLRAGMADTQLTNSYGTKEALIQAAEALEEEARKCRFHSNEMILSLSLTPFSQYEC